MTSSNRYEEEIISLLRSVGAELLRSKKHLVYRIAERPRFVRSKTPSDWRSSRKQLSDLKRVIATEPKSDAVIELSSQPRPHAHRMKLANRDQRERGTVHLPRLTIEPVKRADVELTTFGSIYELREKLQHIDEFWALNSAGRIQLIQKCLSRVATVSVVHMHFCEVTAQEAIPLIQPEIFDQPALVNLILRISQRLQDTCSGLSYPALLVQDPSEDSLLVDVTALSKLTKNLDDILILDRFKTVRSGFSGFTLLRQVETYEDREDCLQDSPHSILMHFMAMNRRKAKAEKLCFESCWVDPKATRRILQKLKDITVEA